MNSKNQNNTQPLQKVANSQSTNSPKLTVAEIVTKFVKPSTHRKMIILSEPEKKKL